MSLWHASPFFNRRAGENHINHGIWDLKSRPEPFCGTGLDNSPTFKSSPDFQSAPVRYTFWAPWTKDEAGAPSGRCRVCTARPPDPEYKEHFHCTPNKKITMAAAGRKPDSLCVDRRRGIVTMDNYPGLQICKTQGCRLLIPPQQICRPYFGFSPAVSMLRHRSAKADPKINT